MYTAEALRVQSGLQAVGLLWRRRTNLLGPWSSWHIQLLLMLRAIDRSAIRITYTMPYCANSMK